MERTGSLENTYLGFGGGAQDEHRRRQGAIWGAVERIGSLENTYLSPGEELRGSIDGDRFLLFFLQTHVFLQVSAVFCKPTCFYRFLLMFWETHVFLQVSANLFANPGVFTGFCFFCKPLCFYRFLLFFLQTPVFSQVSAVFFANPCVFTCFC